MLIGDHATAAESVEWSVQAYVRSGDAPFFLVQAEDDLVADPANTAILQAVCRARGIAVERHLFPRGGHGFRMGHQGTIEDLWPGLAITWMQGQGFLG